MILVAMLECSIVPEYCIVTIFLDLLYNGDPFFFYKADFLVLLEVVRDAVIGLQWVWNPSTCGHKKK